ncbi:MAG: hypothetical protein KatS3mg014_0171 [Actinomycetota bacterium]|nr:MAG: hypothetical protein KatS3mg014_0171 [Actinomycetota bacterium]
MDVPFIPPRCGEKDVGFASAFASTPYTVALPEEGPAAASELGAVYDCGGKARRLEFRSGVHVGLDVNTIADPGAAWERLVSTEEGFARAEGRPNIYSVGTVQGVPALLIDPEAVPNDDANGGVTFVADGVYVSVGGDGQIPLSDLVKVAEAIHVSAR